MKKSLKEILESNPTSIPRLNYQERNIAAPFILKCLKENMTTNLTSFELIKMYEEEYNKTLKGEVLRKIINHLRGTGSPIYSSSKGYRYTTSKAEILDTIISMKVRQDSMNYAMTGMLSFFE